MSGASARLDAAPLQRWMGDLLVELCAIDTSPRADVARMREAEAAVFAIIERELADLSFPGAAIERRPINPAIAQHPFYSPLHQTKSPDRPEGLGPAEAYAGRCNLLYRIPGLSDRPGTVLNAHIDVIAPYVPPTQDDGIVRGRGACDDKGGVVAILAALRLLDAQCRTTGTRPACPVIAMFVIEEEPGGNGSLSLAIDRDLKASYDNVVVLECTGNRIHPANRGAVWYQAILSGDAPLLEAAAFVVGELEDEGRAIKAESRHVLFPQRPVQTCHGMLGPFGQHPSRICGEATFRVRCARPPAAVAALVRDCLEAGLAEYVGRYGDKTQVLDRATGRPKVARHYDLTPENTGFQVTVYGAPGHMGSIDENDGAITKLAALVRALVRSKRALNRLAGCEVTIELVGAAQGALCLEGGQGFVPTHGMDEITTRLRGAAERGLSAYLARIGPHQATTTVRVSYDKLHNAAFDGDADSRAMRRALAAAAHCGRPQSEVAGWTVSCDARLFALEYPGLPVLTVGPGLVEHAHSDQEHVRLEEVDWAARWIAAYLLDG